MGVHEDMGERQVGERQHTTGMRNRRRQKDKAVQQRDCLDGGLVRNGPHGLGSVVLAGDGVGFGGEDGLAAEVDTL